MVTTRKGRLYAALLHYPVYNKRMDVINTSVTNLDIHDIARSAATYDLNGYFLIQPLAEQREMVNRIISYWHSERGAQFNPDRQKAFERVDVFDSLELMIEEVVQKDGKRPILIGTDARVFPQTVGYGMVRRMLHEDKSFILLFGTGWGIKRELMEQVDLVLEPIYGAGDYNHLSVRSAAAIILDRLCGEKWW
ncbi:RNA methyltransferase [Metallumcola ferriviriculae]|uniref:RNA methyltransferase n=1 Tax=Metallumcola ferriviriculae TaxID=3039180 RepID=A0AAU0UNM3_9FIRM|nr:RNA methyltransferase [Desulfitibacteraceae bacterium MK1]